MASSRTSMAAEELIATQVLAAFPLSLYKTSLPSWPSAINAAHFLSDGRILIAHRSKDQPKLSILESLQSNTISHEINLAEYGDYILPLSQDKFLCQAGGRSKKNYVALAYLIDLVSNTCTPLANTIDVSCSFLLNHKAEKSLVTLEYDKKNPGIKKIYQYNISSHIDFSASTQIAQLKFSTEDTDYGNNIAYSPQLSRYIVEKNNKLNFYTEQANKWTLLSSNPLNPATFSIATTKRLHMNDNGFLVSFRKTGTKSFFTLWNANLEQQLEITAIQEDLLYMLQIALLPDNKTIVGHCLIESETALFVLRSDLQQYSLTPLPAGVVSFQVLPSGEIFMATENGHLLQIDIECMQTYRETYRNSITSTILTNTQLIKPLADITASYLCPSRMFAMPEIIIKDNNSGLTTTRTHSLKA